MSTIESREHSLEAENARLRLDLQHAEARLCAITGLSLEARKHGSNLSSRAFASMPAHIAVINTAGDILLVNDAWKDHAATHGGNTSTVLGVGANYLEVCRRSAVSSDDAARTLHGIEQVVNGAVRDFSMEYACHGPDGLRWYVVTISSLDLNGTTGAVISHHDVTPLKLAEDALRVSESRCTLMFEKTPVGIAELSSEAIWIHCNDALCAITGYNLDELRQRSFLDLTHPADRDADAANIEVMRAGCSNLFRVEKRCLRKDGSDIWINSTMSCVRLGNGSIERYVATFEDISERKAIEVRQKTLLKEFAHRGRNLLAVIGAIASLSFSGEASLEDESEAFSGRLEALAKTYGTLDSEDFEGSMLDSIFRKELAPFSARTMIDGPSIILTIKTAQTVALIAHELATNAAKHGALSVSTGSVRISWNLCGPVAERRLCLDWREEGGPPAIPPSRRGFGTTLLGEIAGFEFGCTPELVYSASGFRYRLDVPLSCFGSVLVDSPVRRKLKSPVTISFFDTWACQRGASGTPPQLDGFDWSRFADTGALTIGAIEHGGDSVRFLQIGRALVERLGHTLSSEHMNHENPEKLAEVYLRCARKGEPTHEYLRFDFGDEDPMSFERLLLPFSGTGGTTVTHVVGIAIFEGHTRAVSGAPAHEPSN